MSVLRVSSSFSTLRGVLCSTHSIRGWRCCRFHNYLNGRSGKPSGFPSSQTSHTAAACLLPAAVHTDPLHARPQQNLLLYTHPLFAGPSSRTFRRPTSPVFFAIRETGSCGAIMALKLARAAFQLFCV